MKIKIQLSRLLSLVSLFGLVAVAHSAERPQPNILLLLTDDLGWQDVKCYDVDEPSPMETPNIDSLATKGVMFWQGYSPAPTCAPSRCAIMSGVHPARAQKTHVVGGGPPKPINKNMRMMDPWYSGRMPADTITIAKALRQNGYATGHSGKWHIAIDHKAFPQPGDVGFDYTRATRGSRGSMKNRLKGFATDAADDPFCLDENGYPYHQTNVDALEFIEQHKDKPFFLYYATWLVHTPIHTRSEANLAKYVKKLGVDPANLPSRETPGHTNPFYCAMVEELDYYVGQVFKYLETTEDPRWPGHMLSENTYIIFTSDNGGMEGGRDERYTDNMPLLRGKISAMEGGTRVPLIITGPEIPAGVQTDVLANGLDFYPTILSMAGVAKPAEKHLDGADLLPLLTQDPTDARLVKDADGSVRDTMMWHFPHGHALESTIRVGDYKLIHNYDSLNNATTEPFELYRLYDSTTGQAKRVDIEESKNLAADMPEKVEAMYRELLETLSEMEASLPSYSPSCAAGLPHIEEVPAVTKTKVVQDRAIARYQENGASVVRADLLYTLNGGDRYEEWFRMPATIREGGTVMAVLPEGTTHYIFNLIDENNFLVSFPELNEKSYSRNYPYSRDALAIEE
ncbi:MAG: sulfatase [Lentimonas sp.]